MGRRQRGTIVLAASVLIAALGVGPVDAQGSAGYYLPAPAGTPLTVTQGNSDGNHGSGDGSTYAFDFDVIGAETFPVAASRAGRVIGASGDSEVSCGNSSCWTNANYVLIDHGDGTSALYLHLKPGTVTVKAPASLSADPQQVDVGTPLGMAGQTGYATAVHLHFQVQGTPSPSDRIRDGWWWRTSIPTAFADDSVRERYANGVPVASSTVSLVSANPGTPSPGVLPVVTPDAAQQARYSIDRLLDDQIDKQATFGRVIQVLDALYDTDDYAATLEALSFSYGEPVTRKELKRGVGRCRRPPDETAGWVLCPGNAYQLVWLAQLLVLMDNEQSRSIANGFMKAALMLRSASIVAGLPPQKFRQSLRAIIGRDPEVW
jgi:hypothetical protein